MSYKTFWVSGIDFDSYKLKPDTVVTAFLTKESGDRREAIEVIERRALDEALHIIMETQKFLKTTSNITGASSPSIEFKIDTFISQIKDEGE